MTTKLENYFKKWMKEVDKSLDRYLPSAKKPPQTIHRAMRYSVFAGGKRLRPILVIAGAEVCDLDGRKVLPTACAMELIHTYSLVHDDLPAMDNDDLRRGKPTNHKVFGESIAILTGDALLTYAFHLVARNAKLLKCGSLLSDVVETVAEGAGVAGMVGGQVMDIEMDEGRWLKKSRRQQIEILKTIHHNKTAALIRSSILAGALLAKANKMELNHLSNYGEKIGLAFQVADDILDIVGDKKLLGKKGSDRSNQKLTYPAIFGLEESRRTALQLVRGAKKDLEIFGPRSAVLVELADFIAQRTH